MPEVRYFGNFQMSDISLLDRIPYSTSFQSISNQDVPADALEDAAAPKSKEADEGAKVGRVDVLHVRHRHLFPLLRPHVTPLPQLWRLGGFSYHY